MVRKLVEGILLRVEIAHRRHESLIRSVHETKKVKWIKFRSKGII